MYLDSSGNYTSSCATGMGLRIVAVYATLIDISTRATQMVMIAGRTGSFLSSPDAALGMVSDSFVGQVPSSQVSITC